MKAVMLFLFGLTVLHADGVIAHIAAGDGWTTTVTVVNTSSFAEPVTVWFWGNDGSPLTLNIIGLGAYPGCSFQLPPNGVGSAQVTGPLDQVQQGYATVVGRTVGGNAIFRWQVAGKPDFESSVPITPSVQELVLPFDNTNGFYMGVAVVNTSIDTSFVQMVIRDVAGNVISTPHFANVPHQSFLLKDLYPETDGIVGTIKFVAFSDGDGTPPIATISAIALRFNPTGPFTTLTPAYAGNVQ